MEGLIFSRNFLLAVIGSLWLLLIFPANATQFRHLTVADGLPQSVINDVIQDNQGFIWIATADGLARYDGQQIRIYHASQFSPSLVDNRMMDLAIDNKGNLWLACSLGVYRYDARRDHFVQLAALSDNATDFKGQLRLITFAREHVWLVSESHLYRAPLASWQFTEIALPKTGIEHGIRAIYADPESDQLWLLARGSSYWIDSKIPQLLPTLYAKTGQPVSIDWIVRKNGAIEFIAGGQLLCPQSKGSAFIVCGHLPEAVEPLFDTEQISAPGNLQYDGENYWLTRYDDGIYRFDHQFRLIATYHHDKLQKDSLPGKEIIATYSDRQNNLWVTTNGFGLSVLNRNAQAIDTWRQFSPFSEEQSNGKSRTIYKGLSHPHTRSFVRDKDQLWIATYSGLNRFDLNRKTFTHFYPNSEHLLSPENFIKDIAVIDDTRLFVALSTHFHGSPFQIFNSTSYEWQPVPILPEMKNAAGFDLLREGDTLWVVGRGVGLFRYPINTGQWQQVAWLPDSTSQALWIDQVYLDSHRYLWVATMHHGAYRYHLDSGQLTHFDFGATEQQVSRFWIKSFLEDRQGNMWMGTNKGLMLLKANSAHFVPVQIRPDNASEVVYGILQDNAGRLWLSTNGGLIVIKAKDVRRLNLHPETLEYHAVDGLQGEEFNTGAFFKDTDGSLYFGGTQGFNRIRPEALIGGTVPQQPIITGISLFNENVSPTHSVKGFSIETQPHLLKSLGLDYSHTMFGITFSPMDFSGRQNTYEYQLAGLSEQWIRLPANRKEITFTGLNSGDYHLRIRQQSLSDNFHYPEATLAISIAPPWWQTPLAYACYLVSLIVIPILYVRYRQRAIIRRNQELKAKIEERTSQLKRALREKDEVFTGISHEFRTPLSLILGPAEQIVSGDTRQSPVKHARRIIRNANHLLRLVNQLLGLAASEDADHAASGKIINLPHFCSAICERFQPLADSQEIKLKFSHHNDAFIKTDSNELELIISNLIANALKYTQPSGKVSVACLREKGKIKLTVTDTGVGISEEQLPNIFNRFYRAPNTASTTTGSGIGLSVVKTLTEKSGGSIRAESSPGKGSCFKIEWPEDASLQQGDKQQFALSEKTGLHFTEQEQAILLHPFRSSESDSPESNSPESEPKAPTNRKRPTILLVEDHHELRDYIQEILQADFNLLCAENGQIGLELALREIPDLIISDVMMPVMNGFELCHQLKTNPKTDHIPVILLTAKADDPSRVKGLLQSANVYLNKPFLVEELHLQVKNLLDEREKLKRKFVQLLDNTEPDYQQLPDEEAAFLEKINSIIREHYSDPELNTKQIAALMNFSERQLQRKFKQLAGKTPMQYLQQWRLNKSRTLLKQGHPIGNVALTVGFGSHAYFSKCFKEQFSVAPGEYIHT